MTHHQKPYDETFELVSYVKDKQTGKTSSFALFAMPSYKVRTFNTIMICVNKRALNEIALLK